MNPKFLIVDLFCGAGGVSTGFAQAKQDGENVAKIIACVNHDPLAIQSHWQNHPDVRHFEEDIRTLDLTELVALTRFWQAEYPEARLILWASLECTNFSKAKGGQPRDADSRTLAEHLDRYIEALDPDYVQIENVVEFMSWGPLDEKGKPVNRKNGQDWMRWRQHLCGYGYRDEWRQMNAADFGAFTSRNRLFGIFAKDGLPIAWPKPTHSKNPSKNSMFGDLKKWRAVRECLDFADEGESIFTRKKPLVEKTLERIYAGLVKFVANGDDSFISKYYSGNPESKNQSIFEPAPALTTVPHEAAVFLTKYNSTNPATMKVSPGASIDEPAPTLGCQRLPSVTTAEFAFKYYGKGHNLQDTGEPCGTLTTKDRMCVVFLDQQYGQSLPASVDQPAGTLTGTPKLAACFIDRNFSSGGGKHVDIDGPIGALMTVPKANLVSCQGWILQNQHANKGKSFEEPAPTLLTGNHHYLMSTNFTNIGSELESPAPVITANRKWPYLVSTENGQAAIVIFPEDSTTMQKIKVFMAAYGIVDIKMRMLKVPELLKIQGFPKAYQLAGTQTDQKKFIGNSVVPHIVKAWTEALAHKTGQLELIAA